MKILVTGGAGFIGSAVVRTILSKTSDSVINIDKLTYAGNLDSLSDFIENERYKHEQVDICDEKTLKKIFNKYQPDFVMHLAAESHVDRSIDGPSDFIETNIKGTFNLLDASKQYLENIDEEKSKSFRFLHVSTDEVFGDLASNDALFTETTKYAPSSPYAASKAASDHLVRAWHRTYNLPTIITNCSNNYGPYHFPEKLIPHIILNAIHGKDLPVYGDGLQIRDWLYVLDHARALILVLKNGKIGETYNIGGHNEQTNIEVVKKVCEFLEEFVPSKPNNVDKYVDLIRYVEDRPGHDVRYAIDASKIKNELGWTPDETFESGLRKTVKWYIDNPKWWKRVLSGEYSLDRLGL